MNIHDRDIILSTVFGTTLLYIILSIISSNKQLPFLLSVFIICNMISRLKTFEKFLDKLKRPTNLPETIRTNTKGHSKFNSLPYTEKQEVISSIKSLQMYSANSKKANDKKRRLFKMMTWRQQNLCKQVGYLDKLTMIDKLVERNQSFLNKIVSNCINDYQINFSDFDIIRNFVDTNSYRVIESLSHYNRDWNMEVKGSEWELDSILHYIKRNLDAISNRENTCVIVPGSGLGRIAYELSSMGFGEVHSVEFSGLMYLLNQFVYSNSEFDLQDLEIYPYIHTNSNFKSLNDQYRSVLVPQVSKPSNLTMHLEDFNTFEMPDSTKEYENIVIITAYFIDTAENLMDYMDSINGLVKKYKKAYWINIGPLKYGTAPKVELNMDELTELRKALGWNDTDLLNTLDTPIRPQENGLYGYATDKKSLWQGFYGLNGWCSEKLK